MDIKSLNIESLEKLKYTGCVIKETLRINPPVPGGFRVALKTFELNVSLKISINVVQLAILCLVFREVVVWHVSTIAAY